MNFAIWFDWSRKKTRQANKAGLALIEIQDEILVTIPEGDIVSNIEEKLKETMAEEEKLSGKGLEVEKHDFMKAFESSCKIYVKNTYWITAPCLIKWKNKSEIPSEKKIIRFVTNSNFEMQSFSNFPIFFSPNEIKISPRQL